MILNHKDAIEFLVSSADEIGYNRYTILNLHALLANNLLADPTTAGRLRYITVSVVRCPHGDLFPIVTLCGHDGGEVRPSGEELERSHPEPRTAPLGARSRDRARSEHHGILEKDGAARIERIVADDVRQLL
jgi:hypothetical protein